MKRVHDCPDCTHPLDDYAPGTLLLVEDSRGNGCLWFKSRADRFPWQQVYGSLRWTSGGYNMPPHPHQFVAVLSAPTEGS